MHKAAIGFGLALIVIGVAGYTLQDATKSWTALIPAIPGAIFVLLGMIGLIPSARKHAMHFAAMIALLGAITPIVPLVKRGSQMSTLGLVASVGMLVLCAVFLILCVRSFIAARKSRVTETA